MSPHEADRIAAAANALRPDWPISSLRTLLRRPELASRPRRDVAVALTWVACETETEKPARVLEAGPWWRAAQVEDGHTPRPPKTGEFCTRCGRHYGDCCDNPTRRPPQADKVPVPEAFKAARDAIRGAAR